MIDKRFLVGVAHFALTALTLKLLGFLLPCWITCYYTCAASFLLFLVVARLTSGFTKRKYLNERIQPENRAVLITGCDSGFGNALAKRLDSAGFHVFASCLFRDGHGASELRKTCSKRLQIFELDVTKDESVQQAVEYIRDNLGTSELWALVNNAGVHKGLDVELTSMDDFRDTMEVNAFGPVRVTKAFLPLLRQSRGRVVNLTSIGGRLSTPHLCPYIMSKFAAVAFNECLKQEMDVWGIKVISVEPELFHTQMADCETVAKRMEESLKSLDADIKSDYGEKYLKNFKTFTGFTVSMASEKVHIVIDALEAAVSLEYPSSVYKPCRNIFTKSVLYLFERVPRGVVDLVIKLYLSISGCPKPQEAGYYL